MWLIYVLVFILGSIIGSFLNVVVDRWNTGRGLGGRSKCDVTGKTLEWFELVPILSFLFQGGKSRHSKTSISIQYPLVEMSTGFVFVLIFQKFWYIVFRSPADFMFGFLFYALVFSILISIFVYDWKHKIIPNRFVWSFNILVLLNIIFFYPTFWHLIAGPLVALPFFLLWFISRGKWIGFGDVKLALGIGWMLGLSSGFATLLISFWIGAILGIVVLLVSRGKEREMPFAPFLIFSTLITFLYHIDMNYIAEIFSSLI